MPDTPLSRAHLPCHSMPWPHHPARASPRPQLQSLPPASSRCQGALGWSPQNSPGSPPKCHPASHACRCMAFHAHPCCAQGEPGCRAGPVRPQAATDRRGRVLSESPPPLTSPRHPLHRSNSFLLHSMHTKRNKTMQHGACALYLLSRACLEPRRTAWCVPRRGAGRRKPGHPPPAGERRRHGRGPDPQASRRHAAPMCA